MLKCIIIDDEPLAAELLQSYIDRTAGLELVATYASAPAAISYLQESVVDLVFLDIQMPHINGLQLLRSLAAPPMVIFTTAYSQYAAEGFELDAIDYLLKPFDLKRFQKAVVKAQDFYNYQQKGGVQEDSFIFVKSEYQVIKINFDEIRYIEALDDYIKIYTTSARPVLTLMTLKKILDQLPKQRFARVHRSFIISLSKIDSIRNKRIKIGSSEIPIGNTFADSLTDILQKKV
jgi:DNA-binding LytR/AlgR family response regulator